MKIVCDSREQKGYSFAEYPDVELVRGTLPQGDYAPCGLENHFAIERKSLADLTQCLGRDRERFFRELYRARGYDGFCIVVESTWAALSGGQYPSRLSPESATATCAAIMSRLKIPIVFAGSRHAAEGVTYALIRQYLRGSLHKAEALKAALAEAQSMPENRTETALGKPKT